MIDLDELRRLHEEGQAARVRSIRVWTESSLIAREKLDALMPALLDELESAREALAWYGDESGYIIEHYGDETGDVFGDVINDAGAKARAHQSRFGA